MTGPFEDDGLAHFAQEADQWDPSLEFFYFDANRDSPLEDAFSNEYPQKAPSPPLSPIPVAPAPPTPSSFDPFPDTTDDSYDNISSVGDDTASEIPATEPPGGLCDITSMMSPTEEGQESTASHADGIQWPTSHGKVSMGVKYVKCASLLGTLVPLLFLRDAFLILSSSQI